MEKENAKTEAVQQPVTITVHSGRKDQPDNLVRLIGKITKITEDPRQHVTVIRVRIPRRGRGGEAQFTVPKIYFFHNDKTGVENFVRGDNVQITGHLTNPMKRRPDGTIFFSQAVVGDKIEKNVSLFESELGIDAGDDLVATQPVSLVYLRGEVETIAAAGGNTLDIRMNARQNGRSNHVHILTYQRDPIPAMPGDIIEVYGRLETRTSERGGQYRFYQNVVSQKIVNYSQKEKEAKAAEKAQKASGNE